MREFVLLAALALSVSISAQGPGQSTQPPPQPQPIVQPGQTSPPGAPASPGGTVIKDYGYEDLPPAVQKKGQLLSNGRKIADIDRETRAGHIFWEIEFQQEEGPNDEIYIDVNGILIPEPGLIDFTVTRPPPRPGDPIGSGAPAGAQSGSSTSSRSPTWEELPIGVKQMAARFGGKARIEDIDREIEGGREEYEIEFRREGRNLEIQFGSDGTIAETNDPAVAPVGAALNNPVATAAAPIVPVQPIQPIPPAQSSGGVPTIQPVQPVPEIPPVQGVQAVQGVQPVQGIQPIQPVQPVRPVRPAPQVRPIRPVQPVRPI